MPELGQAMGYDLRVPTPLLMSWVTVLILFGLSFAATRRLQTAPRGLQAFFELAFGFIFGIVDETIGADGRRLYRLFLGLFLFILVGNLIGVVPGLSSPTANLNLAAVLTMVTFGNTHFFGGRSTDSRVARGTTSGRCARRQGQQTVCTPAGSDYNRPRFSHQANLTI